MQVKAMQTISTSWEGENFQARAVPRRIYKS